MKKIKFFVFAILVTSEIAFLYAGDDTLAVTFDDEAQLSGSIIGKVTFTGLDSDAGIAAVAHCTLSGTVSSDAELLVGHVDIASNVVSGNIVMNGGSLDTTAALDLPRMVMAKEGDITIGGDCTISSTGDSVATIYSAPPTSEQDGYNTTLGTIEGSLQVPCYYTEIVRDGDGNVVSFNLHPRNVIVTEDTNLSSDGEYLTCALKISGVRAADTNSKRTGGIIYARQIEATTCNVPSGSFGFVRAGALKLGRSINWGQDITGWEGALGFNLSKALLLSSTAFSNGAFIPAKYTCDNGDPSYPNGINPPLEWKNVPTGTQSLTLIVEDPDAVGGTFNHGSIFNIPTSLTGLDEGLHSLPGGAKGGQNGLGTNIYIGPCPPDHTVHRYLFKFYALDTMLALDEGASKSAIEAAIQGHVLDENILMGRYSH